MTPAALSVRDARWLALEAQGLASNLPKAPVTRRQLAALVQRIGTVQVDAVNVLERTQFIVPFSRLGSYDSSLLVGMSEPGGPLFEYWGHAASLLPVEMHAHFRWRMSGRAAPYPGSQRWHDRVEAWRKEYADYIAAVMQEVRERGPLPASKLTDPRRRDGEWWERRSMGRQALEWLFRTGELAAWRTGNFERVYDLPERVFPPDVLDAATPSVEEAQRRLVAASASALGIGTVADLADYFRLDQRTTRARIEELVDAGTLVPVSVEGWAQPAYVPSGARPRKPRRDHATLLSPFDSLIWFRPRTARLFGVEFRIEIYVPAPNRTFGYYVLPMLLGDEIVARLDLKSDRKASVLRIHALHLEPGAEPTAVTEAAARELHRMRAWLRLDDCWVSDRSKAGRSLTGALRRTD